MYRWICVLLCVLAMSTMVSAFTTPLHATTCSLTSAKSNQYFSQLNAIKNKKKLTKEELSYLEVRDMTREEMLELNAQNERVMNQELTYMTVFSLIISAPLLYLAWVGFFAETAEIAM